MTLEIHNCPPVLPKELQTPEGVCGELASSRHCQRQCLAIEVSSTDIDIEGRWVEIKRAQDRRRMSCVLLGRAIDDGVHLDYYAFDVKGSLAPLGVGVVVPTSSRRLLEEVGGHRLRGRC